MKILILGGTEEARQLADQLFSMGHEVVTSLAGKTSEDVGAQLHGGNFGMARETAEAFAIAARRGAERDRGLGVALGEYIGELGCYHADASLVLACRRAGIPCTVHVALGTPVRVRDEKKR